MNILSPAGVTILLLFCLAGYCVAAECNDELNVFAIAGNGSPNYVQWDYCVSIFQRIIV